MKLIVICLVIAVITAGTTCAQAQSTGLDSGALDDLLRRILASQSQDSSSSNPANPASTLYSPGHQVPSDSGHPSVTDDSPDEFFRKIFGRDIPIISLPQSGTGGTPSVGTPSVGTPSVGIPSVGIPSVGIPSVGIPSVGIPSVGTPSTGILPTAVQLLPFLPRITLSLAPSSGNVTLPSFLLANNQTLTLPSVGDIINRILEGASQGPNSASSSITAGNPDVSVPVGIRGPITAGNPVAHLDASVGPATVNFPKVINIATLGGSGDKDGGRTLSIGGSPKVSIPVDVHGDAVARADLDANVQPFASVNIGVPGLIKPFAPVNIGVPGSVKPFAPINIRFPGLIKPFAPVNIGVPNFVKPSAPVNIGVPGSVPGPIHVSNVFRPFTRFGHDDDGDDSGSDEVTSKEDVFKQTQSNIQRSFDAINRQLDSLTPHRVAVDMLQRSSSYRPFRYASTSIRRSPVPHWGP